MKMNRRAFTKLTACLAPILACVPFSRAKESKDDEVKTGWLIKSNHVGPSPGYVRLGNDDVIRDIMHTVIRYDRVPKDDTWRQSPFATFFGDDEKAPWELCSHFSPGGGYVLYRRALVVGDSGAILTFTSYKPTAEDKPTLSEVITVRPES